MKDFIAVRPAQHYTMGGVRTDASGHSPTLKGLFAAGEAACWDMHGFNRLGGNSVAETVVAGMIVGEAIADWCDRSDNEVSVPMGLVREFLEREQAHLKALIDGGGSEDASALKARMQEIMTDKVGIFRRGDDLQSAPSTNCSSLLQRSRRIGLRCRDGGANPELVTAYRVQKMLKLALCVAHGALVRTESRGAHYREDFPRRDDAQWLKRTLATWPGAGDTLPTLGYEPLDVGTMELPPGLARLRRQGLHRPPRDGAPRGGGGGACASSMASADRFAVQQALMPYEHLLPPALRGRNERLDERFAR